MFKPEEWLPVARAPMVFDAIAVGRGFNLSFETQQATLDGGRPAEPEFDVWLGSEADMTQEIDSLRQRARTPRAAALAGIIFSLLQIASLVLIRSSIPDNPLGPVSEVISHRQTIALGLNFQPFAGIAFLWFIGVVRNRLADLEDRFFATVFLGSGLLYIALMLISAALAGGMIGMLAMGNDDLVRSGGYGLGRLEIHQVLFYASKMAAVFMFSTSTISLQTRTVPRWLIFLGYFLAAVLLLTAERSPWFTLVFPLWVLLLSTYILKEDLSGHNRNPSKAGA
jgi:hypothetical protein